ncbi:HAD-IA family hydrolase [Rathayibacter sp. VKM Ac-2762]|uniref:HAD family hydrolase n=1 Tax=Rathayibacter sp. VKM Ac-2762 TaxID=2609254 RepID=UPI00132F4AA7|nr:HAD family hydrolase [Rathayibacter sp. VKM Ac-2762]QHF21157.1 HAD-IA family hydrolase [Rathayibacter sp. VKM Ac-2762]
MTEHFDLVIFDCDGVLVDSEILAVEVDKRILAEFGWHLTTEEVVEKFMGKSSAAFTAHLEEHLGYRLPSDWDERYKPWFFDAFESSLQPVEGIEAALTEISARTCVASSGSHEKLRKTLGLTNLYSRFEGRIFSASEVAHGKPEPDLFLHAAARMGVPADRCVVVEDSKYGVRAARAAGMYAFGYAGGLTPPEWLENEGATVFTTMADLPELLRSRGPE